VYSIYTYQLFLAISGKRKQRIRVTLEISGRMEIILATYS